MYISADTRTSLLLEMISDATAGLEKSGVLSGGQIKEAQAHECRQALALIVLTAKRHPDWPEVVEEKEYVTPPTRVTYLDLDPVEPLAIAAEPI